MMTKFTSGNLDGYGFDIQADRVVRFNKHADGTYLNTRATYSINGGQYTHYDIRQEAIRGSATAEMPKRRQWWSWKLLIIGALILGILSTCTFEVTTLDEDAVLDSETSSSSTS